jgi:phenylacetate-CoA ligase
MIRTIYIGFITILDWLIWNLDVNRSVHKFFLSPYVGNFRLMLGKVRAVRLYRYSVKHVPAYRDYIAKHSVNGPIVKLRSVSLGDVPEMDKTSYIKKYPLLDTLMDGKLPKRGVMFDESSGSSGHPTSWVRGNKEHRFTRRTMQVAFSHFFGKNSPIVLNTFSMGAWATGVNTTISLLPVTRLKSIGPDITKVINTLHELGSDFDYVIAGYPPFLKQIADSDEIDWSKYKISAVFGGEGISEPMRKELLKKYKEVLGSYGASDLEINIASESPFTIALRQALVDDAELRQQLLTHNPNMIPSIFQYNPYEYLIETNDKDELLVTIGRLQNVSPRIRYNIHDVGHAEHFYDLKRRLKKSGYGHLLKYAELDYGVLFHYGRSDLSVDYNGAVVGAEEIKQIVNQSQTYANTVNNFRLISYEDKDSNKHLLLAFELAHDKKLSDTQKDNLLEEIIAELQKLNLDFKSAYSSAPLKPELKTYAHSTGIFDSAHTKLKNDYVWNIDYNRAKEEKII